MEFFFVALDCGSFFFKETSFRALFFKKKTAITNGHTSSFGFLKSSTSLAADINTRLLKEKNKRHKKLFFSERKEMRTTQNSGRTNHMEKLLLSDSSSIPPARLLFFFAIGVYTTQSPYEHTLCIYI